MPISKQNEKMKVLDMQIAFHNRMFQRYEMIVPNVHMDCGLQEMDIFALRHSGYLDEIEIKISKCDFLADFRKVVRIDDLYENKHESLSEGKIICNYFSFLLPTNLIKDCVIPHYAGLYECYIDNAGIYRVRELKKAVRLHNRKISTEIKYKTAKKMVYRFWYGA